MLEKLLYETSDWRLTATFLGRYKALHKERGIVRKASRSESLHFTRTLEVMNDLGIPVHPDSERFKVVAEGYIYALFGNGDPLWTAYFSIPPHEHAQQA